MKNKLFTTIAVTIIAMLFILQPLVFGPHMPDETGLVFSPPAVSDMLANCLLVIYFYLNYTILIDKYFSESNYSKYLLIIFASFLFIIFIPHTVTSLIPFKKMPHQFIDHEMHGGLKHGKGGGYWHDVGEYIFLFIVVTSLSLFIKLRRRFYASEILRKQSEMALLNAQVNPHFIFNALNTIYILAIKEKANTTSDAALKLSKLLRYSGNDIDKPTISISEEIQYIKDYIDFQKLRFGESVHIEFNIQETLPDFEIATSLLMPFVENCFKYGINPQAQSDIIINITFAEKQFQFTIFNHKSITNNAFGSSGFGIANVQKRLALLYPQTHTLKISDNEHSFLVELNIDRQ
jgi:Histidine kinase